MNGDNRKSGSLPLRWDVYDEKRITLICDTLSQQGLAGTEQWLKTLVGRLKDAGALYTVD